MLHIRADTTEKPLCRSERPPAAWDALQRKHRLHSMPPAIAAWAAAQHARLHRHILQNWSTVSACLDATGSKT